MVFDKDKRYKSGERCEASGIYRVIHDRHHPEHEATVLVGEPFPPCKVCGKSIIFMARYLALHLTAHELFDW